MVWLDAILISSSHSSRSIHGCRADGDDGDGNNNNTQAFGVFLAAGSFLQCYR